MFPQKEKVQNHEIQDLNLEQQQLRTLCSTGKLGMFLSRFNCCRNVAFHKTEMAERINIEEAVKTFNGMMASFIHYSFGKKLTLCSLFFEFYESSHNLMWLSTFQAFLMQTGCKRETCGCTVY